MHTFDFDTVIDRRNTNSMKFDFAKENGLPEDVLPLWVADMDFKAPDCVRSALDAAVQHGIFKRRFAAEPLRHVQYLGGPQSGYGGL